MRIALVLMAAALGGCCDISGYWDDSGYSERVQLWDGSTVTAGPRLPNDDGRGRIRICGDIFVLGLNVPSLDLPTRVRVRLDGDLCEIGELNLVQGTVLAFSNEDLDTPPVWTELPGWTVQAELIVEEGWSEEPSPPPGYGKVHVYQNSEGTLKLTASHEDGRSIVAPEGRYWLRAVAEGCSN
ncbi:MAG: hypothetical protein KJO07_09410 [Deltaproteobacteria bacterium]|nr:hypothetical protein [Deltaproteobacteria bacterium]